MKRIITMLLVLLCFTYHNGFAQTNPEEPVIKNLRYGLIAEFGLYGGYQNFGMSTIFVNNMVFKEKFTLGVGVGMEIEIADEYTIPLFVNFRHYLPARPGKKLQPLVNVALGTRICIAEKYTDIWYFDEWGYRWYDTVYDGVRAYPGLYATIATGFKVGMFSFTTGLFFKSGEIFTGGVETKCGFTF
ncbi:hypothetical protein LJC68_05975 [Bacteroidales bacterium OttesenSCG-928-B11]|nr:hypothetical protein [Bacteroidales bacterium OttesenSCG-928-E04]MDL2312406.1 hypothetical protein [Bacteroidales bacterium OttesenSCG-928-B11]MDL2326309.1 hypothetical protein [Bacteroidales bacterium OttesenSCG-928-A14]